MGHIKEPEGVDLNIGPMPFSAEDRQAVSAIIAQYKSTGEMPKLRKGEKNALSRVKENIKVDQKFQLDNFDLITWFLVSV